jgi:hypothetical protein
MTVPVKRRLPKTKLHPEVTPEAALWARDEEGSCLWPYVTSDEAKRATWNFLRDEVVREHVAEWPGTRPIRWWQYDSSPDEPRLRLGGVGTTWHQYHSRPEVLYRGRPTEWFTADTIAGYVRSGSPLRPAAVAVDPDNPPLFESEASYLKRLGLFLKGEAKRLEPEDFEPEPVVIPPRPPPPINGTMQDPALAAAVGRARARAAREGR